MDTHCFLCGIEYKKDSFSKTDNFNFKYISYDGTEMCGWCARFIPCGLVSVALGQAEYYINYTRENWKEFPALKERIEYLKRKNLFVSPFFCPKCNSELREVYSEWAMKNIKKCSNCGWC